MVQNLVLARPPVISRGPNVLLVITDDQGWGDVRSHGNDKIDTPIQDKLAAQGARFHRFYVSPVCAPTRASLLTGRDHLRTGTSWVTHQLETMGSKEVTIAEMLRQAGYLTGCFGKWHNGAHYPNHPNGQGFDEFFGFCGGHWCNYFDTRLEHNGKYVKTKGYITNVLTDKAIEFIEKNKNKPFFCYVPYNAPHSPFQVPDRYFDKYKARGFDNRDACIYGMVENIDDNLGRLLNKIDELKLTNNTIVLFLTDNGPNGKRYNGGMKGAKGSSHEGGVRVPLFIRWPGYIQAGITIEPITAHIDLLPTIVELCGIPMPETLPLDGKSLVPLLQGKTEDWPERMLFTTTHFVSGNISRGSGAVRTPQYRLVKEQKSWALYDMIADPGQAKDIARDNPKVVNQLRNAYDIWLKDVTRDGIDRLPIPVGYIEWPVVEMPAPDGYMSGNIRFNCRIGWATDWFTNWTSTEDYVWWNIDVVRTGSFEVTLLYTCPADDVGSKVCVEVGNRRVEGFVTKAHDPELIFSPDRVESRGNSPYEKVWAPLRLGTIKLDQGQAQLQVRALTKTGNQVFDLKAVRLRRID
ncbi:MAG: arylsulfatase [Planctomycetota bacterium]|nr:MAG: arylsulfatase [Planctomycetota bacterium]